jgi:hypothetical protein
MSLATRLNAFFLTALALVLAGFSVGLYLAARSYLYGELDARLDAALDTLAAAAEVEPDRIEWDPVERALTLGQDDDERQPRWLVVAPDGRAVSRSPNSRHGTFPADWRPEGHAAEGTRDVGPWRMAWRRLAPGQTPRTEPLDVDEFDTLLLAAGLPVGPSEAALSWLALALAALSGVLWTAAALAGRLLCRRALAPVARMAASAGGIGAANLGQRLPSPGTGDELEGLCRAFNGVLARLEEASSSARR